jgi:hypothetical protein
MRLLTAADDKLSCYMSLLQCSFDDGVDTCSVFLKKRKSHNCSGYDIARADTLSPRLHEYSNKKLDLLMLKKRNRAMNILVTWEC